MTKMTSRIFIKMPSSVPPSPSWVKGIELGNALFKDTNKLIINIEKAVNNNSENSEADPFLTIFKNLIDAIYKYTYTENNQNPD